VTQFDWDFDADGSYDATTTSGSTTHAYTDLVTGGAVKVRVTDGNGRQSVASARLDITHDGDTVPDDFDNCPDVSNPMQEDLDSNGTGDACQDPGSWSTAAPEGPKNQRPPSPPILQLLPPHPPRRSNRTTLRCRPRGRGVRAGGPATGPRFLREPGPGPSSSHRSV
jgi:cartilage oligomeric matrix protein